MKKSLVLIFLIIITLSFVQADEVEDRLDDLEDRVFLLEELVDLIKAWLFYSGFDDVCDAVDNKCAQQPPPEIECSADTDCGQDGYITDYYCMDGDVWRNYRDYICYNAGTEYSYCSYDDLMYPEEYCGQDEICQEGACVLQETTEETVIFRTNAEDSEYKSGTWIAVDTNDDDVLEGYDYTGSTGLLPGCSGTLLVDTPEGYEIYYYRDKVYVCIPSGAKALWKKYYEDSSAAETSTDPTSPYSENNQEVYEGEEFGSSESDGDDSSNTGGVGGEGVDVTINGTIIGSGT